jgi:hypothetical protein
MPKIPSRYYKKSRIEQLKSFCTVVETNLSVTRASEKLNISPASVTTHIQSLEYDLGFKLFDRIKGKLHLTKDGKIYYHRAIEGLNYINDLYNKPERTNNYGRFRLNYINFKNKLNNNVYSFRGNVIKFFKKVFIKIKVQYLVGFLIFFIIGFFLIHKNQLNKKSIEDKTQIVKSIAKNINDADNALSKTTSNTAIFIKEYFASHPKMNKNDLLTLGDQINNPTITIYDKDGYFYLTTSRAMDPAYEHYEHYKNLSVLKDKPSSKVLSTMQTCVRAHRSPNKVFVLPIYGRKAPYNNVTKNAILYDNKLDKIFDISYSGKDIQKIIDQNFDLHPSISYLAISDQHGNVIIESGENDFRKFATDAMDRYSDQILFKKSNGVSIFRLPFGGEKDVAGMTTNGDTVYFYVLTVVFEK